MNLLEISSYLFRQLREFPGDLTCMCGSANLHNFASVTYMGPNAQYYQRHRKTARNYTTVTRFENVIFGVVGDNFQHFLLVHMLLQTRELHNRRPWALLFSNVAHSYSSFESEGQHCNCRQPSHHRWQDVWRHSRPISGIDGPAPGGMITKWLFAIMIEFW